MTNKTWFKGTIFVLTAVLTLTACSGKTSAQSGGKENPATDFSYDLTADSQGILIKGYTGGPGKVVIPAKIEDLPVLEIEDRVFDGESFTWSANINTGSTSVETKTNKNAGITSITIPDTVRKIGIGAFSNTAITSFNMPDSVTEIGLSLFSGCTALTEVRLSDNIEEINDRYGTGLFGLGGSSSLKKFNLPKNLKRIGTRAFSGLSELTELVIPDGMTVEFGVINTYDGWLKEGTRYYGDVITSDAFKNCGKLPLATRQKLKDLGYIGEF